MSLRRGRRAPEGSRGWPGPQALIGCSRLRNHPGECAPRTLFPGTERGEVKSYDSDSSAPADLFRSVASSPRRPVISGVLPEDAGGSYA